MRAKGDPLLDVPARAFLAAELEDRPGGRRLLASRAGRFRAAAARSAGAAVRLWVVGLWAFHSLVHAELRYNFPVLPMMLMLAVLGVQACWKLLPAARRPKSAAPEQAKTTERTQECPQLSNPSHP